MRLRRYVVPLLAFVLIGSCAAEPRHAVRPDPPGPLDLIRSIWGDYSSRCPQDYDYCAARRHAVCCPVEDGCCEDADGPYCCSRRRRAEPPDEDRRVYAACNESEITCSHAGRTVCCASSDGCCAGPDGPYCCALGAPEEPDRDGY